jgi:hypothetical protein
MVKLSDGDSKILALATKLSPLWALNQAERVLLFAESHGYFRPISNNFAGTLLNCLFGTDFDVMDETRRRQTTKGNELCYDHDATTNIILQGIWMCPGKSMDVLVMDVEGDDCRERTGHQVSGFLCCLD